MTSDGDVPRRVDGEVVRNTTSQLTAQDLDAADRLPAQPAGIARRGQIAWNSGVRIPVHRDERSRAPG